MIIEFLGVPGCGKTYYANLYKNELNIKGISYIDLSRWRGMPLWLKVFYKFADKAYLFFPKYRVLRNRFRALCKDVYGKEPKYLPFSVEYCIGRIISSVFLQDIFGGGNSVVINDEGLMQWVVFLSVQYNVLVDKCIEIIQPFNVNCKTKFIDIPVETAFANIKKRNRHVCPMDEMKDDELLRYLEEFNCLCHKVELFC